MTGIAVLVQIVREMRRVPDHHVLVEYTLSVYKGAQVGRMGEEPEVELPLA
jgi:hypothetical protein